jgi:hypothetical protein
VLSGADYTARLNKPTPWTRKCVAAFTNTERALCAVAFSSGGGAGGLMMTLRYDVIAGREAAQREWLATQALPALSLQPGICGVHLCVADVGASTLLTEEKKVRPHAAIVPNWVLLVECAGERAALEAACAQWLPDNGFAAAGACAAPARGVYLLQLDLGAPG